MTDDEIDRQVLAIVGTYPKHRDMYRAVWWMAEAATRERCIAICRKVMDHHTAQPDCVPEPGEPGFRDGEACGAEDCIEAIQRGGDWP